MGNRNSGAARDGLNFYTEPAWVTELLLGVERFEGLTCDPCCGHGTIPRAFRAADYDATGSDIDVRSGDWTRADFLHDPLFLPRANGHRDISNIVFNPPYSRDTEKFLGRARSIATKKVAALLPLSFLAIEWRFAFFEANPPARIWILSSRPSMPPGELLDPVTGRFLADDPEPWVWRDGRRSAHCKDIEYAAVEKARWRKGEEPKGGSIDYCWIVWDDADARNLTSDMTRIGWLVRERTVRMENGATLTVGPDAGERLVGQEA